MSKRRQVRRLVACACAALAGLAAAGLSSEDTAAGSRPKVSGVNARRQEERVDIRLRSLTTRATGQLTVEASAGGGRARLTALNLPEPQTVNEAATTYVVWALSGGRVLRLGELRRDERGNGGLAFERPAGFERYGIIVTAETRADVERPGDPVLATRADEAGPLYPSKPEPATPANAPAGTPANAPTDTPKANSPKPAPLPSVTNTRGAGRPGDFYAEVDDALAAQGGGRVIELVGDTSAPNARASARAGLNSQRAYVRANFRGVPLPSAVGASVYVLWGVIPDGRIVYMGSLPATEDLNRAEVYVRVPGFESDDYTLLVTAERARPAPAPDGRHLLKPADSASVK